jgi:hypothetical protein
MSAGTAHGAVRGTPGRLHLLWHTIRYLQPRQIFARVRLRAGAIARGAAPRAAAAWYGRSATRARLLPPDVLQPIDAGAWRDRVATAEWDASVRRASDARNGRFTFLSESADLGCPVDWSAAGRSRLWRYQLHYGGYLLDLVATQGDGWAVAESLMREWVTACPMGWPRDAWHPFVVSERLVNWTCAILLGAPSVEAVPDAIWRSLAIQASFVDRNLETDVGGNHLLKNLKAMSVASTLWRGATADRWREQYVCAFDRELASQLLSDGVHYERSPMYHLLVLVDAVEVVLALRRAGCAVPESLAGSIRLMRGAIGRMVHPDGEIALFNDSVFGEAPPAPLVEAAAAHALGEVPAGPLPVRTALLGAGLDGPPSLLRGHRVAPPEGEDGGIVQVAAGRGRGVVLIDVGRACPDTLPAHAHADFFSYELSLDGRRLIVDAGVGEYAPGPWREYYRSTRAHNTVSVDGLDQIECWGSFRVARRARVLDRVAVTAPGLLGVTARHDGYTRLRQPVQAGRTLVALDDRAWLVIDDLSGPGSHEWESCIHAAPDAVLDLDGVGGASLTHDDRRLAIAWFGVEATAIVRARMQPRQGWHAPAFGRHLPASVLQLRGRGRLPVRFGYVLVPDARPGDASVTATAAGVEVRLGVTRYRVAGAGRDMRLEVEGSTPA